MDFINLSFLRSYGPYVKGNTASFSADSAKIIIQSGAAVVVESHKEPAKSTDVMPDRKSTKIAKK